MGRFDEGHGTPVQWKRGTCLAGPGLTSRTPQGAVVCRFLRRLQTAGGSSLSQWHPRPWQRQADVLEKDTAWLASTEHRALETCLLGPGAFCPRGSEIGEKGSRGCLSESGEQRANDSVCQQGDLSGETGLQTLRAHGKTASPKQSPGEQGAGCV